MSATKESTAKATAEKPRRQAPSGAAAQRSLGVLVVLLLLGFAAALFLQADAYRRETVIRTIGERRYAADVAAEQANSALVHAWGALA
ncbi:MAG: hypothetical protein FD160_2991, partial [Caulobacteraceae bacterium]